MITNGAVYAEVVPRRQRVLVQETPAAATFTVVDTASASVSEAIVSCIYL